VNKNSSPRIWKFKDFVLTANKNCILCKNIVVCIVFVSQTKRQEKTVSQTWNNQGKIRELGSGKSLNTPYSEVYPSFKRKQMKQRYWQSNRPIGNGFLYFITSSLHASFVPRSSRNGKEACCLNRALLHTANNLKGGIADIVCVPFVEMPSGATTERDTRLVTQPNLGYPNLGSPDPFYPALLCCWYNETKNWTSMRNKRRCRNYGFWKVQQCTV